MLIFHKLNTKSPTQLPYATPYSYPFWIYCFLFLILGIITYASMLIPPYASAVLKIKEAKNAYLQTNYSIAAIKYIEAVDIVPSSRTAILGGLKSIMNGPITREALLKIAELSEKIQLTYKDLEDLGEILKRNPNDSKDFNMTNL